MAASLLPHISRYSVRLQRAFFLLAVVVCMMVPEVCSGAEAATAGARHHNAMGEVFEMAETMLRSGREEDAMSLYNSITADCSDDMTDDEKLVCAKARMREGELYEKKDRYSEALEAYVAGMMVGEGCGKGVNLMLFYKKIGNIYSKFGDHGRALSIYEAGYALRGNYPDRATECDILFNMAGMCYFTHDIPKARKYLMLAKRLVDSRDPVKAFMSAYSEGLVLLGEKSPAGIRKLKEAAAQAPDDYYRCHAYEKLYQAYSEEENADSCFRYLTLCNDVATANSMTGMTAQTLNDLTHYYKTRDPAKAAYYRDLYNQFADSIINPAYNLEEFYRVRNVQYLYELEKTDRRISDLQTEKSNKEREIRFQRTITAILAGVLLMAVVFLWLVARQKRTLSRAYRDLFDKNNELLKNDAESKVMAADYEKKIKILEKQVEELEKNYAPENQEPLRYQASNLNEDSKRRILSVLSRIMDEEKAFCRDDFSLGRLAELAETNQTYLSQVINESFGKNFTEYVNEYRIREVQSRLLDTERYGNLTIEAVAESVGFRSRSTFSRTFRKITGIPPSVYQKMSNDHKRG